MNKLFHRDVFMPIELAQKVCCHFKMQFSRHAKDACLNDRYGIIIPPTSISPKLEEIIEIEAINDNVIKAVIRIKYDVTRDLLIAFIPEENVALVKTLWFNLKSDSHKTLDKTKYQTAP